MPRGSCSLPSSRLEKTTRSSPHHVAQHRPTGSETTPPYAPRSSRFGSEPPSVDDDVDVWRYAILELHARNDDDDHKHSNRPARCFNDSYTNTMLNNLLRSKCWSFKCGVVTDLSAYLKHVVSLGYNDRPDYQHCRGLFTKALKSVGAKASDKLDFGPAPVAKTTTTVMLHLFHYILTGYIVYYNYMH